MPARTHGESNGHDRHGSSRETLRARIANYGFSVADALTREVGRWA